jgi:hypothetical protein
MDKDMLCFYCSNCGCLFYACVDKHIDKVEAKTIAKYLSDGHRLEREYSEGIRNKFGIGGCKLCSHKREVLP